MSYVYFRYESGGAGTIFLNDNQKNTTKLIVNNNNVGTPITDDITNITYDGGRTWLTPSRTSRTIQFDQVDIRGKAQLAVLSNPPGSSIQWAIKGFTGDLSGILHIQENQRLTMTSSGASAKGQRFPLGVNVYPRGDVKLPENLFIDGVKVIVAGSVSGAHNVTIGNEGKLVLRYST